MNLTKETYQSNVAPLAGAWIETPTLAVPPVLVIVAPLAGAWIETRHRQIDSWDFRRRAPRGRVD